jgi:molybdate transport system ATP-binding protein
VLEVCFEKSFGNFDLSICFKAEKGALGILGSSGSGKSMTLKCIAGLFTPDKGKIKLNNSTLFSSDDRINVLPRKRNIGYVFQNYALFPHMTVSQNIAYGVKHIDKQVRNQKVMEMIQRMQLVGFERHYPSQLSGGQQQRVALGRTLITEPELLMLDEPLSALDSHIKHQLEKELITIIKHNYEGIVLLVTHSIEEAYRICSNIMVIDDGQNIQSGKKDDLIRSPLNPAAARITGCKNLLGVTVLGENDDNFILQSNQLVFKAKKADINIAEHMVAGIRAHYLSLSTEESNAENTFTCDVIEKIEGVFSTTTVVNCGGCEFRVETEKAVAPHFADCKCKQMILHIPPEYVFLMKREG